MGIGVCRLSIFRTEHLHRYEEGSTLTGIIYVHRISDNRFGGVTGRNFNMFRKLCGESTLRNLVLVTNMWGEDPQDVNEAREKELSSRFFKLALDKGAQMARHDNTIQSAHDILRSVPNKNPVVPQIQRELVDESNAFITGTAELLNHELGEQLRRHQADLGELRNEMAEALKWKDEEMRQELEEAKKALEEKATKATKASEGMAANYAVEKERVVAKMKEVEQGVEKEREQVEVEYDRNLAILIDRLQRAPNASAADRAGWEQEIKRLQDRITIPIYL